jgi:hypothetical protein
VRLDAGPLRRDADRRPAVGGHRRLDEHVVTGRDIDGAHQRRVVDREDRAAAAQPAAAHVGEQLAVAVLEQRRRGDRGPEPAPLHARIEVAAPHRHRREPGRRQAHPQRAPPSRADGRDLDPLRVRRSGAERPDFAEASCPGVV